MNELVSVIIPAYNAENTIENTIKSVINQRYKNLEILIVDDHSTDNTKEILDKILQYEDRIKIYRNDKNYGVSYSRNYAIKRTVGKYIAFLDSDDEWKSDKIEKQIKLLQETNADMCYTSAEIKDSEGKIIIGKYNVPSIATYNEILKENYIICSSVVLKKSVLPNNPFSEEYFHEDLVLWLDVLKNGIRALGISESLTIYKKGGRSSNKLVCSKNRWIVYRNKENLGFLKSFYYFIIYAINGLKKCYIEKN